MAIRMAVAIAAAGLLPAQAALAQTYTISTVRVAGLCQDESKYSLTIAGDEITGRSPIGSGFKAKVAADGTFKAVFKSFTANRDVIAEGSVNDKPRRLKISIPSLGCVLEGTE